MESVHQILRMNGGEGNTSYASNSLLQKQVILKAKSLIEESITQLYQNSSSILRQEKCIRVADLGCSSGPNSLLPTWEIIDTIDAICSNLKQNPPLVQVFLNDLTGNDFNTVFKTLPEFYKRLEKDKGRKIGTCFVAGIPGSFYERLFPNHFIHFLHSSYSLHWLSQVPRGVVSEEGEQLNKGTMCLSRTSPESVHKAYLDQFEADFTRFLQLRSEEIVCGGRLVLSLIGRNDENDGPAWEEIIGLTMHDMVIEGLIEEAKLDEFNIPVYSPTREELIRMIKTQGSFDLVHLEKFKLQLDGAIVNVNGGNDDVLLDKQARSKRMAMVVRAVSEPMLTTQFEAVVIDKLFERLAIKVMNILKTGKCIVTTLAVSLIKK